MKTIFFKLWKFITLLWVYIAIVALMTLTLLQGHRWVRIITCNLCVWDFCPLLFNCCMVAAYVTKIMHSMMCMTGVY